LVNADPDSDPGSGEKKQEKFAAEKIKKF